MYAVSQVYNTDINTKFYLIYDWEGAEYGKVSKWFQTLTTTVAGDRKVNCLPMYNFDCNNLVWSGNSVVTSITLEL